MSFEARGGGCFTPLASLLFYLAFILFIVLALLKLKRNIRKSLYILLLGTIFVSYFLATLSSNFVARTEVGYCENWLRKFPDSFIAMNLVANFYRNNKGCHVPEDLIPEMLNMVDLYIKNDYPQKARELIESISSGRISLAQRNELLYKLAAYHCKNGHHDQCEEMVRRIIGPKNDPDIYLQLSYTLYQTNANPTAVHLLKQCITLHPKYKEAYLLLGVILANDGHYEESINFWKQGRVIDPADLRFVSNIDEARKLINKGR